ncbi:hypothetical protein ACO2Q3_18565 [Caulobacter sp. KR2-114]|uniref:hypothetical protein n=1 Tax=Caulobacter sp. KR2-114 TaxID=3400912 RepID=UPI003C0AB83F
MDFFRSGVGPFISTVMAAVVAGVALNHLYEQFGQQRVHGGLKRLFSLLKAVTSWGAVALAAFGLVDCVRDAYVQNRHNLYRRVESYPPRPTATAKPDAIAFYRAVQGLMRDCDVAQAGQMVALGGADPVSKYQAAKGVERSCDLNGREYRLTLPRSAGHDIALSLGKASSDCAMAALYRIMSANDLDAGLKRGDDVVKLARSRDSGAEALILRGRCETGLRAAMRPLGVTDADLAGAA